MINQMLYINAVVPCIFWPMTLKYCCAFCEPFPWQKLLHVIRTTFTMEAYHSAKIKHSQPLIVPLMKQKLR